jgi:hypothetical protein
MNAIIASFEWSRYLFMGISHRTCMVLIPHSGTCPPFFVLFFL